MGSRVAALVGLSLLWLALLALPAGAAADASTPVDGTVTTLAPLPQAVDTSGAASLTDGRVLAMDAGTPELYDPQADSWSPAATPIGGWSDAVVALPGDRAFVLYNDPAGDDEAEIYDGATNTWGATAPMESDVYSPTAAALPDGRVLVVGGWTSSFDDTPSAAATIYDSTTNTWSAAAPMLQASFGVAVDQPDGTVLFLGNDETPEVTDDINRQTETYDPATNAWTLGDPLPATVALIQAAAELPDGRVAIVGSNNSSNQPKTDMIYDPATDGLVYGSSLPYFGEPPLLATLVDGRVVVAGGVVQGVDTTSVEAWTPPAPDPGTELAPVLTIDGDELFATSQNLGAATGSFQLQRCTTSCVDVGAAGVVDGVNGSVQWAITSDDVGATMQVVVTADGVSATSTPTGSAPWERASSCSGRIPHSPAPSATSCPSQPPTSTARSRRSPCALTPADHPRRGGKEACWPRAN